MIIAHNIIWWIRFQPTTNFLTQLAFIFLRHSVASYVHRCLLIFYPLYVRRTYSNISCVESSQHSYYHFIKVSLSFCPLMQLINYSWNHGNWSKASSVLIELLAVRFHLWSVIQDMISLVFRALESSSLFKVFKWKWDFNYCTQLCSNIHYTYQ